MDLTLHLVGARHVEGLAAEGAVRLVELFAVGRLFVGLEATDVVLARQRGVVTADEAAARQDAHLPVEVPRRQQLALRALGHREEVDLLVLVPVHEVPRLPLHAARRCRHAAARRGRRRRARRCAAERRQRDQHDAQRQRHPQARAHGSSVPHSSTPVAPVGAGSW